MRSGDESSPLHIARGTRAVLRGAVGVLRRAVGVLRAAVGVLRPAVGVLRPAVGVLRPAVGVLHRAVGVLRLAVGVLRGPYYDTNPLANPAVPEVREYMVMGMIDNEEIGLPSDIVSIVFAG